MAGVLILDLETQNNPFYGAIASPRHPDNWPVMIGTAYDTTPYSGVVETQHYPTQSDVPAQWLNIPDDCWLIVAHNAAYEMDWFLFCQRPQIMAFLKRGGRIWCTALAEYLLSHQLETYPSLDETAPKYGGTTKVDGIKILWNQGVRTADIDPALLLEYLSGAGGDIENTRKVFYGQYALLTEAGMLGMFFERCEALVFNTMAMDNGLYVNKDIAFKQREEGEAKLAALAQSFEHYRSHIPPEAKFNAGSDFHVSAWLFGGPLKYTGKELATTAEGVQKWVKGDFLTKSGEAIRQVYEGDDLELIDFDHGPFERYKAGKNKGVLKVSREDTAEPLMRNCEAHIMLGPLIDLTLLPQSIYKDFKKEFSGKRVLADNSPVYSTGKDCLDMLALRSEFPEHITKILKDLQEWARLDKDLGTYYLREELDDAGNVVKQSGMLQYLTPMHYVYHTLNCTATITTRLSSTKPNFQNLPRGDTSDVKNMFTSRYGQHGFIVEADYAALEVVTLAAFSKDKALTRALLDGIDMHCMRLSQQLNEPYEEVLLKCKDSLHPLHAVYSRMRTDVKPKAFAYQYGATAQGIAFATGCTVEAAQAFIDAEKALFPEVELFYDEQITPIVQQNTKQYREMTDAGGYRLYGRGHWQAPGGTCYSFRQYEKSTWAEGQRSTRMEYKPTQIRNYPIQGESGYFVQVISGKIMRWLVANDFFPDANGVPRVCIINTVHDAFYFDCHKDVLDVVCSGVKQIMESLPQVMNAMGYDLGVPFPAAVEFGPCMNIKMHWHQGVLNDETTINKLKAYYDQS